MKAERTYDHIMRDEVKTFAKNAESRLKIKVNPQRKSLMGILLLFIELYAAGARDSKKTLTPISPKWRHGERLDQKSLWWRNRWEWHVERDQPFLLSPKKVQATWTWPSSTLGTSLGF